MFGSPVQVPIAQVAEVDTANALIAGGYTCATAGPPTNCATQRFASGTTVRLLIAPTGSQAITVTGCDTLAAAGANQICTVTVTTSRQITVATAS